MEKMSKMEPKNATEREKNVKNIKKNKIKMGKIKVVKRIGNKLKLKLKCTKNQGKLGKKIIQICPKMIKELRIFKDSA